MKIIDKPDGAKVITFGTVGCLSFILIIVVILAIILGIGVRIFNWIA